MLLAKVWYFFYFGGLVCVWPYINLLYRSNGLNDAQIGVLAAVKPWVSAPSSFLWSGLADTAGAHKLILIATFIVSTLARTSTAMCHSFVVFLVLAVVAEFVAAPVGVMADAAVVAACKQDTEYGKSRLWGAVAWGGLSLVSGWMVSKYGMAAGFAAYALLSVPCVICASKMEIKLGKHQQQEQQKEHQQQHNKQQIVDQPGSKQGNQQELHEHGAHTQQEQLKQCSLLDHQDVSADAQAQQQDGSMQLSSMGQSESQPLLAGSDAGLSDIDQPCDATQHQSRQQHDEEQQQQQESSPHLLQQGTHSQLHQQQAQEQLVQCHTPDMNQQADARECAMCSVASRVDTHIHQSAIVYGNSSNTCCDSANSTSSTSSGEASRGCCAIVLIDSSEQQCSDQAEMQAPLASSSFWQNLVTLLSTPAVLTFMWQATVMGFGIGVIGEFLFLFIQDLGGSETLMGLTLTMTCVAEVPVFHYQDRVLQHISVHAMLHIVLWTYMLRLGLYALLPYLGNVWMVLPVELLHGITFGCGWGAGTITSKRVAPPELAATMQGIFQGLYFGVGQGLGALIGGVLKQKHGGQAMFAMCSGIVLAGWVLCVVAEQATARLTGTPSRGHGPAAGSGCKYAELVSRESSSVVTGSKPAAEAANAAIQPA